VDNTSKIAFDAEVDLHVDSFIRSSNLVRYSIITLTIASILLFVGYHNSASDSWFNSRLNVAYTALHAEVWLQKPGQLKGQAELAREWAESRGFRNAEEIKEHIKTLEDARTNRMLLLEIPFFGASHDVNDLGFFGSIALTILMLMLTFSMSRQHENLYLVLWIVRRAWRVEGCREAPTSYANLIYHTLAMSQQFSQPPTLARWKSSWIGSLSKVFLTFPLLVQVICLRHDWNTRKFGQIINSNATTLSLAIQCVALIAVFCLSAACFLYTRSNDRRWSHTFFAINPSLYNEPQPSWLEWVQFSKPSRQYVSTHHGAIKDSSDSAVEARLEHAEDR
jgi:hypothetical protein